MARTLDQIIRDTLSNQLVEIARLQSAIEQQSDEIRRLETLCRENKIDPAPPKSDSDGTGVVGPVGVGSPS